MHHGPRSLAGIAIETFALRALTFGIGVGVNVAVSRTLGPEGRGQYALAVLGAITLAALAKVGLEHANVYLLGTARVAPERLASQNALIALGGGLTGAIVLILAPAIMPSVFGDVGVRNLALAAMSIPLLIHIQVAAGLQNLTGRVTWQFRAALAGGATQLAIVLALLALGRLDVTSALLANLFVNVLTWVLLVAGDSNRTLAIRVDLPLLMRTLRYSLVVHIGLVLLFFQTRITLFLVQALMGTGALGHYSLAVSVAESVLLASDSLAIALLPRQTGETIKEAASLGMRGARVGALLVIAAGIPLATIGSSVITVMFGAEFAPSYPPLLALLPGIAFLAIQRFCGAPALRANRPARMAAIYGVGVLLNVVLNLLWIPRLGLIGAGASTSVSYLATAILFVRWTRELARTDPPGMRLR
ncbi:MAG: polysaccharide biosynthesis C-terminal domain-containing protein [Chloroflexi bacterium]|nr:polysaccharide biosynthesis C-terminal domain-containing protein [Chloroflexota bacterium]